MPQNTLSIEQLNLSFIQAEDRLLLKVGMSDQSEISLWLTRRICKELWYLLQDSHGQIIDTSHADVGLKAKRVADQVAQSLPAPKLVSRPHASETAQPTTVGVNTDVKESLEVMDFSTEYDESRVAMADTPILIVECNLSMSDEHITRLTFKAQTSETIKMGLTLELVVAMTNMMQLATREAGWDLLMLQNNISKHFVSTEQVLH